MRILVPRSCSSPHLSSIDQVTEFADLRDCRQPTKLRGSASRGFFRHPQRIAHQQAPQVPLIDFGIGRVDRMMAVQENIHPFRDLAGRPWRVAHRFTAAAPAGVHALRRLPRGSETAYAIFLEPACARIRMRGRSVPDLLPRPLDPANEPVDFRPEIPWRVWW